MNNSRLAIIIGLVLGIQAGGCSTLGPAFDGHSCGNVAARNDLEEIIIKELVKNGWPEDTAPLIQTRVTYPEDIRKNNPEFKCRALLHAKVGQKAYESFTFAVYYNYEDYKVMDYKSEFTKYQKMKIADLLAGKLEPLAHKSKACTQTEREQGCEDGRDKLHE